MFGRKKHSGDPPKAQTVPKKAVADGFPKYWNAPSLTKAERELYSALREAVPLIDAALGKIVRLTGGFGVVTGDGSAQNTADVFVKTVAVNSSGMGLKSFAAAYLDSLLTYGEAIGEMIPSPDGRGIASLYNASLDDAGLAFDKSPLEPVVFRRESGACVPVKYPQLVVAGLLGQKPGKPRGTSVLAGLPFVSSVLLKILGSLKTNWERIGDVRFAVTYNPPAGAGAVNARQRVKEIAEQWSSAMRDKGRVCDFVSVGDVNIRAIGADSQILDCDIPIRHVLEQIVAKLSIPPFLLGLSWSSTERMSSQQADILTSELEYYRLLLTPVIEKIARVYLSAERLDPRVTVEWSNISLQDETELAAARLDNARAEQLERSMEVNG